MGPYGPQPGPGPNPDWAPTRARRFGFISHEAAAAGQAAVEGMNWDGYVLHAEWARTEFRPVAAAGGSSGGGKGGGYDEA